MIAIKVVVDDGLLFIIILPGVNIMMRKEAAVEAQLTRDLFPMVLEVD